ncbi:hypothetical protein TNIN_181191 [Trichonephila inaurata madagascariensis]|uniref:Uncharacterized protein n=1 Tax=Trichonephila inaurata madagascariensis TaxID=2747483 RepID=A0A8X6XXK4_9ARAC|nr:hypothetical protein TNIN_181191 [Trichonephila inaurata madagascariensis]
MDRERKSFLRKNKSYDDYEVVCFLVACNVKAIVNVQCSTTPIVQRERSSVNEHYVLEEHDKLISLHYQLMNYNIILDRMFAFAAISGCNVRVGDVSGWDVLLWMA